MNDVVKLLDVEVVDAPLKCLGCRTPAFVNYRTQWNSGVSVSCGCFTLHQGEATFTALIDAWNRRNSPPPSAAGHAKAA